MRSHILGFGALVLAMAATAVLCPDASADGDHHWQPQNGQSWFEANNWDLPRGGGGLDNLYLDYSGQPPCILSGSNDIIRKLYIRNGNVLKHIDCTLETSVVRVGYENQTGSYYLTRSNARLTGVPAPPWYAEFRGHNT